MPAAIVTNFRTAQHTPFPLPAVLTKLVRVLAALLAANGGLQPKSKQLHEQVGCWPGHRASLPGRCRDWQLRGLHGHQWVCSICWYAPLARRLSSRSLLPPSLLPQVLELLTRSVLPAMSLVPGNAGAAFPPTAPATGRLLGCQCSGGTGATLPGLLPGLTFSFWCCFLMLHPPQAWCTRSGAAWSSCPTLTASASMPMSRCEQVTRMHTLIAGFLGGMECSAHGLLAPERQSHAHL